MDGPAGVMNRSQVELIGLERLHEFRQLPQLRDYYYDR